MRPAFCLVPVLAAAALLLTGCGYEGDPKPPALMRPLKATDLSAVEHGAKIVVTFTLPSETTEGLPIPPAPDVELRIGALPSPWNLEQWVSGSDRVPVPSQPAVPVPVNAPVTPATSTPVTIRAKLARRVEIDAAKYVGKPAVVGIRVHGPKGRDDGWATFGIEVVPVVAAPRDLKAADAPNAVHLTWVGDAPSYRIFHRLMAGNPADANWVPIGTSTTNAFDDKTFEYGKTWQYYVQATRPAGDGEAESEASETISFTPKDVFPPAVPTGLTVIAGARSAELSWDSVADADLAAYRVYRNGVKVADALTTNSYSDKDVVAGSKYSYQVSSVDMTGNESARSVAAELTME
jgi:hypothetical protein